MNIFKIRFSSIGFLLSVSLSGCATSSYHDMPLAYSSVINPYTNESQVTLDRPIEGLMSDVNRALRSSGLRDYELLVQRLSNKVDGNYSAAPVFGLDSNESLSHAMTVFSGTSAKVYAPLAKSGLLGGQQKPNCKSVRPNARRLIVETEVSNLDQNVYLKVAGWQVYRDGTKSEAGYDSGNVHAVDIFQLTALVLDCDTRELLNSQTMSIAVTHGNRDRSTYIFALVKGGAFYRDTLSEHPGYNGTKDKGLQVLLSNIGIWLGELDPETINVSINQNGVDSVRNSSYEEIVVRASYRPKRRQKYYFPRKLANTLKCKSNFKAATCDFDFYGDNMKDIKYFVSLAMNAAVSNGVAHCEIVRRKSALRCKAKGENISFDPSVMKSELYSGRM